MIDKWRCKNGKLETVTDPMVVNMMRAAARMRQAGTTRQDALKEADEMESKGFSISADFHRAIATFLEDK